MRAFAIFKDQDGDPIAVRAEDVVIVEARHTEDKRPDGYFTIITDAAVPASDIIVEGPFEDVIKELEICIDEGNAWEL